MATVGCMDMMYPSLIYIYPIFHVMSQNIMSSQQRNNTPLQMHEKALSDYYFDPAKPGAYYGPSKSRDELKANRPPHVKLRKVKWFVKNQDAYSLHKPVRHNLQRMRVRVNAVNEMFDLIILTIARNENVKSNYVERFNRTLKSLITRYMTHNNTKRYLEALPELVSNYNNTKHSSLPQLSSARVNKSNEVAVWNHTYLEPLRKGKPKMKKYLFKVGDLVRISYVRKPFSKELDLKWTEELFRVARRYKKQ